MSVNTITTQSISEQLTSARLLLYSTTAQPWSPGRKELIKQIERDIFHLENKLIFSIREGQVWKKDHGGERVIIHASINGNLVYTVDGRSEKVRILASTFVKFYSQVESEK